MARSSPASRGGANTLLPGWSATNSTKSRNAGTTACPNRSSGCVRHAEVGAQIGRRRAAPAVLCLEDGTSSCRHPACSIPATISINSLWPLPSTPHRPVISPALKRESGIDALLFELPLGRPARSTLPPSSTARPATPLHDARLPGRSSPDHHAQPNLFGGRTSTIGHPPGPAHHNHPSQISRISSSAMTDQDDAGVAAL